MRSTRCETRGRPKGDRKPTDLVVNLAGGHGGVAQVLGVAVGRVDAAGGGNAVGWVVDAAGPAGVVVDAAAAQLGWRGQEAAQRRRENSELVAFWSDCCCRLVP